MNRGQLLEQAYRAMGAQEISGTATSGTTLTIVDSKIANIYQANKFTRTWAAFIPFSSDGAAPQSEYVLAASFARATGTITVGSAFTAAPGAGDRYSLFKMPVQLYEFEHLADQALKRFGFSFLRLDTSLTTATSTLHYTLPLAIKTKSVIKDLYLRDSDNNHIDAPLWEVIPAAGGSSATLRFLSQPKESETICIKYAIQHPSMDAYSDTIEEAIPDNLAILSLAELGFRSIALPRRRVKDVENWKDAIAQTREAIKSTPIQYPADHDEFLNIGIYG